MDVNVPRQKVPPTSGVRRRFFLAGLGVLAIASALRTGKTMAHSPVRPNNLRLEQNLATALHQIGSSAAVAAADDLARAPLDSRRATFHLRNGEIASHGAALIARALSLSNAQERARLRSFSLSYNEIGDAGAAALAAALPSTLTELGLVGCSIGDRGGRAILDWARRSDGMRLICIEDNTMSAQLREQFMTLRTASPAMSVFV